MDTPVVEDTATGSQKTGGTDLIKDTTTQNFVGDVIEASKDALVLVDFWAPWCGPCKQLTPVLKKVVNAAGGSVRLVKLNIDEHPAIPGQMGVQSIPAVFAFKDGRPVDGFMGALPESQVKTFIEKHMDPDAKAAAGAELEAGKKALEDGDIATAGQIFASLLQNEAGEPEASAGLIQCYIAAGELERAEDILAQVIPEKASTPAVSNARAMLELARKSGESGDVAELQAQVEKNPQDHQLRFDLAIALNASDDRDGAVEQLLHIASQNREWNDDGARKQLVEFFEAWGPGDPATLSGRQRLSLLLFS